MESRISLLEQLIDLSKMFDFKNFSSHEHGYQYGGTDSPEWLIWKRRSYNLVKSIVADQAPAAKLVALGMETRTNRFTEREFLQAKGYFIKALELTLDAVREDSFNELRQKASESISAALSNRVFVVHGHDHGLKTDMESFLHQIGLEPVVLHRQPDEGQTIIEKFERHSDVGYAFILLTPDELAYTADQEFRPDSERQKEARARANVIFEFGYFVGKLGRKRVCCLHKGDVVLPSDLSGLIYKKVEASVDSQAYSIIRELKAAGYQIKL